MNYNGKRKRSHDDNYVRKTYHCSICGCNDHTKPTCSKNKDYMHIASIGELKLLTAYQETERGMNYELDGGVKMDNSLQYVYNTAPHASLLTGIDPGNPTTSSIDHHSNHNTINNNHHSHSMHLDEDKYVV